MSTEATNREAALALAEALGNLPLALEQAAAYTRQTGLSLADYLELFRERAAAYVPSAFPSADYPAPLAVTFEIAFARLLEESPAAADLLTLCAFLAPDDVPLEIFKEVSAKEEAAKEEDEAVQRPDALATAAANPDALATAAASLQTYALAKVRGGSFLSMHRLTQAISRDRLGDDERKSWAEVAVTLMVAVFQFKLDDTRTWPPSAPLLQHVLTVAEHAKALDVAVESNCLLFNQAGVYLLNNAEWAEAQTAFEKSLELGEELFGPTHPEVAVRLNNIGHTLLMQENLDEAAEYLMRALAITEAELEPDRPKMALRLNNMGGVLYERGAYSEAREHFERALAISEAVYGPTHPQIAITLGNIGAALYAQDDLKGACAYFERAIPMDEEAYGRNHPNVAIRLNNLGTALLDLGDVDAARQRLERALNIFLEHFGEKHPSTLNVKRTLEELDNRAAGKPRRRKRPRRRRK